MSTSLIRQLSSLAPPSTSVAPISGVSADSALLILDPLKSVEIGQIEFAARDAFKQIAEKCSDINKFRALLFDKDDDQEEDDKDGAMDGSSSSPLTFDDLLLALSPFLLVTPGQILLQFVVNRHKVHLNHPEALLWAALPHHKYKIFNRISDVLPMNQRSTKYPAWVESFRLSCHPCTVVGLHKHVARDRGFFKLLCDLFVKTCRRQAEVFSADSDVNFDGITHFFVSVMLGGLESCSTVSETQVLGLMQVIFAGLKSDHTEFHASAATLLAKLFPRVSLKAKVANKAVKVLMKSAKGKEKESRDSATLAMLLIAFKYQRETVDAEKVLRCVVKMEETLVRVIGNDDLNQREDEEIMYALKVISALSSLSARVLSDTEPTEEGVKLLEYIKIGLGAQQAQDSPI